MTLAAALASLKIRNLKAVKQLLSQVDAGRFKDKSKADCKPTLLKRAAECGTLQVFAYLVEHEDANTSHLYGNEHLHIVHVAALSGQLDIVSYLIGRDRTTLHRFDSKGRTPLQHACRGGHAKVVSILLKAGADVQQRDARGGSALHYCSFYGHQDCLKLLLRAGANPTVQTFPDGVAPCHLAAKGGHQRCLKALKMAGVDMNCVDARGWTILHHACAGGSLECVDYLIKTTAIIQTGSVDQLSTPFHIASWEGSVPCLKRMVEAGVDPMSSNKFGVMHCPAFCCSHRPVEMCPISPEACSKSPTRMYINWSIGHPQGSTRWPH